jgi:hypothetical protein
VNPTSAARSAIGGLIAAAALSGPACKPAPEEFPDPDVPAAPTNPDGLPYPTDHIGSQAHSRARPGDRIANLSFRAYRNGVASGLQSVSLSEYFDPQSKRNKVLEIQVAATWCEVCDATLLRTLAVTDPLRTEGAAFLEVVVSGETAGKGPSLTELDEWVNRHQATAFPIAIDVEGRRVGALGVSTVTIPYDIMIDTRTMEILESSVGEPIDIASYVRQALTFVETNPPAKY